MSTPYLVLPTQPWGYMPLWEWPQLCSRTVHAGFLRVVSLEGFMPWNADMQVRYYINRHFFYWYWP